MIACSLAVWSAGVAHAVPVLLDGGINFTTSTDCSPWCGSTDAKATLLGAEGGFVNGQLQGGGAAATSAILGGGGFLGKASAATASFEWWASVQPASGAGGNPFHLFFDWDATLFASHDALLGQAAGGIEFEVTSYKCVPMVFGGCFPIPTFYQKRVYTGSVVTGELWDLGLFDQSDNSAMLHVTFDVGSAATTIPWVGVYAEAIDIGMFGFTLRADDGLAPPAPVPEPATLAMVLAALAILFRRVRRQ